MARGSIEYSPVTQPSPESRFQRGTPSVKEATHRTRVLPNSMRTEPSPVPDQPRVMETGRSWDGVRPSARRGVFVILPRVAHRVTVEL